MASNPALIPPNPALSITAQNNSDTGAVSKWEPGHNAIIGTTATDKTATP
jgi:hypothetical protein